MELPDVLRQANVTPREAEVLEALGGRLTNAEIAERFVLSVRTVESHVSALLGKLEARDRLALSRIAQDAFREQRPRAVPFPGTLAGSTGLVGRSDALASLRQAYEAVAAHRRRSLVVIEGEAGIGKTSVAAAAAADAHRSGAIVLHARCEPDPVIPFEALIEAVRPISDASDPVGDLFGGRQLSAADERYAFFERFERLVAARPEPIVLVIDDVQWADPSTLQLVRHLLRGHDRSALLALATTRPEGAVAGQPFAAMVAILASFAPVETLHLGGLSLADAATFAHDLPPDRVQEAWGRTGGNPFFFRELLRAPAAGLALPATARDAIVRRVAGLGPRMTETLSAAAIAGERFRADVVSSALGGAPDHHLAAIDRAWRAGLIVESEDQPATYRFAHAIIRDALIAVTSPSRQTTLHLALAEDLEATGNPGALPEIAHHRHAALPAGEAIRARQVALAAADAAMERYAYEVGAAFATMALDAIDAGGGGPADRAAALAARGEAHRRAGELDRAAADFTTAHDLARRTDDGPTAAKAVLGWAATSPRWERNPELASALEKILATDADDRAIRAELRATLARVRYYDADRYERVRLARDAVADARAAGRRDTLASVLETTHAALWAPGDLDERTAIAEEVVALARSSGHVDVEADGVGWLAIDRLEAGDTQAADWAFARHAELADRLGGRLVRRDVELWRAMRTMLDGDLDAAGPIIERARDLGEAAHDPAVEPIYWVGRYWLACERGNSAELDELVGPCERFAREFDHVPAWRAALALLHARRGDRDAASGLFDPLAADDFAGIPHDFVWLNAMTYLAETCAFLGDSRRASTLYLMLTPFAGRVVLIDRALACKGAVARFLGLLASTMGDIDAAARHLTDALACHEAMGARLLIERTRAELAAVRASGAAWDRF